MIPFHLGDWLTPDFPAHPLPVIDNLARHKPLPPPFRKVGRCRHRCLADPTRHHTHPAIAGADQCTRVAET
jgi:hypothetical protein